MLLLVVAWTQAVYYVLTGLWPLVSIGTFQRVTGPKVDLWLVRTVGAVLVPVGLAVGLAAAHGRFTTEVLVLAVGTAAALAAIDIVYVARRVIARIYLLDAVAEILLVGGWVAGWAAGHGPDLPRFG